MVSKFHICATWQPTEKHGQGLSPAWGLVSFFMPCKKGPPTSWQKSISSLVCSHVDLHTVLTDGGCPHGKPPVLTCNGILRGGY